ncbi:MAG: hypothetical protein ACLR78_10645 [Roseburia sp.]
MQDIAAENRGKVTAYVGAGGKTSSIRKRAETLRAEGKRVLILTTTKMMVPQEQEIFAAYEQTGQRERNISYSVRLAGAAGQQKSN